MEIIIIYFMYAKKLVLFIVLSFIIGCKYIGGSEDPGVGKACTLMGSSTIMHVKMLSGSPLPSNLSVALNGNEIDADECVTSDSFLENYLEVNEDRSEANVVFQLDFDEEDREYYFPDNSSRPNSDLMNIAVYSRPTCDEDVSVYQVLSDLQISWEPIYANGESCGITSYTVESEVEVP